MTTRRDLLHLLPGLALLAAWPTPAQRRDRPARIAMLDDAHEGGRANLWAIFRKRLQELGYAEGKNFLIEPRWSRGEGARLPALAAELVALKPDVIVTAGTPPALAAKQATSSIPIVALGVADPVGSGLVTSLARPDGNITGITNFGRDMAGKWLELVREIAPTASSLALLTDTDNKASMLIFRELQARARPLGIAVQVFDGRNRSNVERAFGAIARERMDGLIVSAAGALLEQRRQIIETAAHQRIPAVYGRTAYVDAGGLLSYGADLGPLWTRAADYVHRILQGTKPAELPIEQASTFKLVLNFKTAKALGLKIPQSILVRADVVIQ